MSALSEKLREESKRRRERWKYALVECDDADAAADRIEALEDALSRIYDQAISNEPDAFFTLGVICGIATGPMPELLQQSHEESK